ncbi:MAG: GlxA family transcriptional regulator [Roseovarius sp.]
MTANLQNQTKPHRRVAILGFDDVVLMDIAGPAQVFGSANKVLERRAYTIEIVTHDGDGIVTDTGLRVQADCSFQTLGVVDDLVIPGGPGVDHLLEDAALRRFLIRVEPATARVVSVCSGSLLTAATGMLNTRQATTHWERADMAHQRFGAVAWQLDKIFTKDGKFHCSAGVTTGIDLALSLVEADHGRDTALGVAREMVVFMQRHGGQSQYSDPLRAQSAASTRFSHLYSLIEGNPTARWSARDMAQVAGTTERTLYRDFMRDFRQSPSRFVEERRLALARQYLERSRKSVKEIATLSGFGTEQKLRRSFIKRLGVLPTQYRTRFGQEG